jgi:hypothetical protein
MTGISEVSDLALSFLQTSIPLIPGKRISKRIKSGVCSSARLRPSLAVEAKITLKLHLVRRRSIRTLSTGLSSIKRMVLILATPFRFLSKEKSCASIVRVYLLPSLFASSGLKKISAFYLNISYHFNFNQRIFRNTSHLQGRTGRSCFSLKIFGIDFIHSREIIEVF